MPAQNRPAQRRSAEAPRPSRRISPARTPGCWRTRDIRRCRAAARCGRPSGTRSCAPTLAAVCRRRGGRRHHQIQRRRQRRRAVDVVAEIETFHLVDVDAERLFGARDFVGAVAILQIDEGDARASSGSAPSRRWALKYLARLAPSIIERQQMPTFLPGSVASGSRNSATRAASGTRNGLMRKIGQRLAVILQRRAHRRPIVGLVVLGGEGIRRSALLPSLSIRVRSS